MGNLFLLMLCGHALADFPLQGDYLAKAKNRFAPLPGTPWFWGMFWHCTIHGGFVAFATGYWVLGFAEFIVHWLTDDLKCGGKINYTGDQLIHIGFKILWAFIAVFCLAGI